jgi:hypothetical protein
MQLAVTIHRLKEHSRENTTSKQLVIGELKKKATENDKIVNERDRLIQKREFQCHHEKKLIGNLRNQFLLLKDEYVKDMKLICNRLSKHRAQCDETSELLTLNFGNVVQVLSETALKNEEENLNLISKFSTLEKTNEGLNSTIESYNQRELCHEQKIVQLNNKLESLSSSKLGLESQIADERSKVDSLLKELSDQKKVLNELEVILQFFKKNDAQLKEQLIKAHLVQNELESQETESLNRYHVLILQSKIKQDLIDKQSIQIATYYNFLLKLLNVLDRTAVSSIDVLKLENLSLIEREEYIFTLLQKTIFSVVCSSYAKTEDFKDLPQIASSYCNNPTCNKVIKKAIGEAAVLNLKVLKYQNSFRRLRLIVEGNLEQSGVTSFPIHHLIIPISKTPAKGTSKRLWNIVKRHFKPAPEKKLSVEKKTTVLVKDLEILMQEHLSLVDESDRHRFTTIWIETVGRVKNLVLMNLQKQWSPVKGIESEIMLCLSMIEKLFALHDYGPLSHRTQNLFQSVHNLIMETEILKENILVLQESLQERDEFIEQQLYKTGFVIN